MGTQQSGYSVEWILNSGNSAEWVFFRVDTHLSGHSAEWELSRVAAQDSNPVRISVLTLVVATKGVTLCFSELQVLHL